jgi:hypothetical protein
LTSLAFGGHCRTATHYINAAEKGTEMDHDRTVTQYGSVQLGIIREEYRQYKDNQTTKQQLQNRICAIIRRLIDCSKGEAVEIARVMLRNRKPSKNATMPDLTDGDQHIIKARCDHFEVMRQQCEELENHHAKQIRQSVEGLPVWNQASDIRGLGALVLGEILAEAGALSRYASPAKLWIMMGVGLVQNGDDTFEAQRRCKDKKKAALHRFSPRRRALMWNIGQTLVKLNNGEYRALYDEKKRQYGEECGCFEERWDEAKEKLKAKTCGHCDRKAQRCVEKRLLRNLWRMWN